MTVSCAAAAQEIIKRSMLLPCLLSAVTGFQITWYGSDATIGRRVPVCAVKPACRVRVSSSSTSEQRFSHVFIFIIGEECRSSHNSYAVNVKAVVAVCSVGIGCEHFVQFAAILCLQKPMHQSHSQPSARKSVMWQWMLPVPIM